jgi:hypothetical protein
MRKRIGAAGLILTKRLRAIFARLLMTIPFVGAAMASSAEGRVTDDGPAIARVEQIRQQMRAHDDKLAPSRSRQTAQWYNFPNWPNWKNWGDWDNIDRRRK